MEKSEIIIALIKDHLINTKLLETLKSIKVDADEYTIYAGDNVFKLMELGEDPWSDDIYENYYMVWLRDVFDIQIREEHNRLNSLAETIYLKLKIKKLEKEKATHHG